MPKWKEWKEVIDGKEVRFYRVRGTPEGKEKQRIFRSDKHKAAQTQAKRLHDEWERAEMLRRGEKVHELPRFAQPKASFQEVARCWLDTRRALKRERASIHDYQRQIDNHLVPWVSRIGKEHDIRLVNEADMVAFVGDLIAGQFTNHRAGRDFGRPLGVVAQRKLLTRMKAIMKQAKQNGHITDVPGLTLNVETPSDLRTETARVRKEKVWQWREVFTLLRAADSLANSRDMRRQEAWGPNGYRALTYFVVFTGVRISEALAVKFEHLDLDRATVSLEGGIGRHRSLGPGKNPASFREIVLHRGLVGVLRKYITDAGMNDASPGAYLFSTADGRAKLPCTVHQRGWEVLVAEANRLAKDPNRSDKRLVTIKAGGKAWHGFRRFVNSLMLHSNIHEVALRAFMGHSGPEMTRLYSYALDEGAGLEALFVPEDGEIIAEPMFKAS